MRGRESKSPIPAQNSYMEAGSTQFRSQFSALVDLQAMNFFASPVEFSYLAKTCNPPLQQIPFLVFFDFNQDCPIFAFPPVSSRVPISYLPRLEEVEDKNATGT